MIDYKMNINQQNDLCKVGEEPHYWSRGRNNKQTNKLWIPSVIQWIQWQTSTLENMETDWGSGTGKIIP